MRARRTLLLAPLAALLTGCVSDAPQQYQVTDLRILAIRDRVVPAAPIPFADAEAGEQLELEALAVNPAGPAPSVAWYACAPTLLGPPSSCLDPQALVRPDTLPTRPDVFALGTGATVTLDLTAPAAAPLATGVAQALAALLALAVERPELACSLFVDLPVVAVATAGAEVEVAVKRVRILPPPASFPPGHPELVGVYVRNQNPAIDSVRANAADPDTCAATDGTPVTTALPGGKVTLCLHNTDESNQVVNLCRAGSPPSNTVEQLGVQWYASGGTIDGADFNGNAEGTSIDFTPPGSPFTLWVILRDGRGGTDWVALSL